MLIALIGAAILAGAIVFQKRVVETGWDPAPHRPPVGEDGGAQSGGGRGSKGGKAGAVPGQRDASYDKVPAPVGAPAPPPPPE